MFFFRCIALRFLTCVISPGLDQETNFLTACQINGSALADYRRISVHCDRVNSGDPLCHDCSPQGARPCAGAQAPTLKKCQRTPRTLHVIRLQRSIQLGTWMDAALVVRFI